MRWRRQGERGRGSAPARAALDPGRPLEPEVRGRTEARLGHDFSTVRIHHGPQEAKAPHARAFTVGEDVTFGAGQYAPGTARGDRLLAHELGHVVDHRAGAAPGAYRAPEGQEIPTGPERPVQRPGLLSGSLSLGLDTLDAFAFNGSDLTQEHRRRIPELAARLGSLMGRMPSGRITITGHTDLVGGEQANADLGRKRAAAVAAALVQAGIPRSMIDLATAGESAPVVKTEAPEPRNRRVEVRFAGAPLGSEGEGPRLRLGEPPTVPPPSTFVPSRPISPPPIFLPEGPDPHRPPGRGTAPKAPQQPQPAPARPGEREPQTRSGSAGDVAKAFAKIPEVKRLIDEAEAKGRKDLGSLSTADKVVLGTVSGAIVAGAVAGIASDPATRRDALDFVDGKEIPSPWPGISFVPHTKGGGVGGGLSFDVIKIFGGGKK